MLFMDKQPQESQEIVVDKDKFDAVLKKIALAKPLPLKDLAGTFPRVLSHRRAKTPKR